MAAAALIATACAGAGPNGAVPGARGTGGDDRTCVPLDEIENGDVENALAQVAEFPWDRADPEVLEGFDLSEVVSGGPPPDGIQPIDDPCFDDIADGEPLVVTYCPLCNSGLAFERTLDGTLLDFAPNEDDPSLFADQQTGSTWNLLGEAVDGELTGSELTAVSRDDTFWFVWFAIQPDTVIVGAEAADA